MLGGTRFKMARKKKMRWDPTRFFLLFGEHTPQNGNTRPSIISVRDSNEKKTHKKNDFLFVRGHESSTQQSVTVAIGSFCVFFVGPLIHLPSHDDVIIGQWQAAVSNRRPPKGADSPMGNRATHWPQRCHFGHCSSNSFRREYLRRHRRRQRRYWRDCEFFFVRNSTKPRRTFVCKNKTNEPKKKNKIKKQTDLIADGGRRKLADGAAAERFAFALRRKEAQFFFLVLGQRRTVAHLFRNKN